MRQNLKTSHSAPRLTEPVRALADNDRGEVGTGVGRKEFDTLCGIVCQALGTPYTSPLESNAAISIPGSLVEGNASVAVVITRARGAITP